MGKHDNDIKIRAEQRGWSTLSGISHALRTDSVRRRRFPHVLETARVSCFPFEAPFAERPSITARRFKGRAAIRGFGGRARSPAFREANHAAPATRHRHSAPERWVPGP